MSANDPHTAHEEGHTGPVKTPGQLLLTVFYSFVVPVFAIIALVYFVVSGPKPSAGADKSEQAVAERIRKVGLVEIRDANRPLKAGEEVYNAQCAACHNAGAAGAPKLGDLAGWAPRLRTGYEALWQSALKGKGAMGAQGGGDFTDVEIGRAVVYLTNKAGGKFAEPAAPKAEEVAASK
jgi:cytochrome c5